MWALQSGCVSRSEFYARLKTPAELRELEIAYELEPWGDQRDDLRTGIVASAAVAPYAKKGRQPRPIDFMPFADRSKPRQTDEQMRQQFKGFAAAVRKLREKQKAKADG